MNNNEVARILRQPPTEENLNRLPIFTGMTDRQLDTKMLHKSYHPDVSLSSIMFNSRANGILKSANIKTIGELLLTSYTDLLIHRNCGLHTIEAIQDELRGYILDKEFDYSPYWEGLESMFRNVLKTKERNILMILYRLGIGQQKSMTLQECGDKFGITREAARQIVNQTVDILVHPETEFKLRPFWLTVDKLFKKKSIMMSEDFCRRLKSRLAWRFKPETHAVEAILKFKPEKYVATFNGIVGLRGSKCFECHKLKELLPEIMKDRQQVPYREIYKHFYSEFQDCCPEGKSLNRDIVQLLVELHIKENLKKYPYIKRRPVNLINTLFSLSKTCE